MKPKDVQHVVGFRRPDHLRLRQLVVIIGVWTCVFDVRDTELPKLAVVADRQRWQLLSPDHAGVIWKGNTLNGYSSKAIQLWLGELKSIEPDHTSKRRLITTAIGIVSWMESEQHRSIAILIGPADPRVLDRLKPDVVVSCVHLPWRQRDAWLEWCNQAEVPFWPAASGRAWLSSESKVSG